MNSSRKSIFGDWYSKLESILNSEYFNDLGRWIQHKRTSRKVIYPENEEIFKAFQLTPYEKVKVCILGQSPYYTEVNKRGVATGLAFASSCQLHCPASLQKIFDAWEKEVKFGLYLDRDYSLEYLCKEGVLLLNRTLTTQRGLADAHKGKWDEFTKEVLKKLNDYPNRLVFLVLGKEAEFIVKEVVIDIGRHLVLYREHPAASVYGQREWKSDNCFNIINKFLEENGKEQIRW